MSRRTVHRVTGEGARAASCGDVRLLGDRPVPRGLYHGSALVVHRRLHDRHPLSANHFVRWLQLWNAAIDEKYHGPVAERAAIQAARIAKAMHRRAARRRRKRTRRIIGGLNLAAPHMHSSRRLGIEDALVVIDNIAI